MGERRDEPADLMDTSGDTRVQDPDADELEATDLSQAETMPTPSYGPVIQPEALQPDEAESADEEAPSDEVQQARERIEQTRRDLSETVDAIRDRLDPRAIAEEVTGSVRDATTSLAQQAVTDAKEAARRATDLAGRKATEAGMAVKESVQQNPGRYAAAAAGVVVGLLVMKARGRRTGRQPDLTVSESASSLATDGSPAHSMGRKAEHLADMTQQQAAQLRGRVEEQAQGLQRMAAEKPWLVGGIVFGLGCLLALALPETPAEHEVMGEARDNLIETAQEKVQETVQDVRSTAQETLKAAKGESPSQS